MIRVLRALLLTLLVGLVLMGGLWFFQGGTTGLRPLAIAYMERLMDEGKMFEAIALDFQGPRTSDGFRREKMMYEEMFGAFRGAGPAREERMEDGHGYLALDLEFERATVPAVFEFQYEMDKWRVSRATLEIPRDKNAKGDYADPETFSHRLLMNWAKGRPDWVWEHLAQPLRRAVDEPNFESASKVFLGERGAYQEVRRIATEDKGGNEARIDYEVVFEDGSFPARVELIWSGGRWFASVFEVEGFER